MKYLWTSFLVLFLGTISQASAEIVTKKVEYAHGGQPLEGYLAFDSATHGKRPGILIIHQWKGISAHEEGVARKLATLGYVVFAADIYGKGIRPKTSEEAGQQAGIYKKDLSLLRNRVLAGLEQLKTNPDVDSNMVAAFGYCFGGLGVLELARSGTAIQGVVSFHGTLATPQPEKSEFRTKVLVHHGANDPYVVPEEVKGFIAEMTMHHVDWQMSYYGGAVHAFTDHSAGDDPSKGAAYNAEADTRSWNATLSFLKEIFGR